MNITAKLSVYSLFVEGDVPPDPQPIVVSNSLSGRVTLEIAGVQAEVDAAELIDAIGRVSG